MPLFRIYSVFDKKNLGTRSRNTVNNAEQHQIPGKGFALLQRMVTVGMAELLQENSTSLSSTTVTFADGSKVISPLPTKLNEDCRLSLQLSTQQKYEKIMHQGAV